MSIELLLTRAIPDDEADYIGSGSCDRVAGGGLLRENDGCVYNLIRSTIHSQVFGSVDTRSEIPRSAPPKGEFSERTSPPADVSLSATSAAF